MNYVKKVLIPTWPAPPRVKSLITLRNGGVSSEGYDSFNLSLTVDDLETNVLANREILMKLLPSPPKWITQVHGEKILLADQCLPNIEADGSYTNNLNIVCVVMVADCVPVLVCDQKGSFVGVVHAGWKGIIAGILEKMIQTTNVNPSDLLVYLGPGIGPSAFEISEDLYEVIIKQPSFRSNEILPHPKKGKWYANLFQIIRNRLNEQGIFNVYGGKWCTFTNPDLYVPP